MATPQRNNATLRLREIARISETLPTGEAEDRQSDFLIEELTRPGLEPLPIPKSTAQHVGDMWHGTPPWVRILVLLLPLVTALVQAWRGGH